MRPRFYLQLLFVEANEQTSVFPLARVRHATNRNSCLSFSMNRLQRSIPMFLQFSTFILFFLLFFLFVFSIIKLSSILILRVFARKPHNFPLISYHFTFLPKRIYLSASTNVEHWVETKCSLPAYLFLWFRSGEGVFYGRTIYVGIIQANCFQLTAESFVDQVFGARDQANFLSP